MKDWNKKLIQYRKINLKEYVRDLSIQGKI